MKVTIASIIFLVARVVRAFPVAADAAAICGSLGVMEVPAGADPSKYRQCRDHPLYHQQGAIARFEVRSPLEAKLFERACVWEEYYGCAAGFCWTHCGEIGSWCWVASNGGNGEWATCSTTANCPVYTWPNTQTGTCGTSCNCDTKPLPA